MAKHGGYPMGMMGGGNMQALMKQAQKMQENMAKKQAELNEQTFTASAGGGMVTATVYGTKKAGERKDRPPVCGSGRCGNAGRPGAFRRQRRH